MSEDLLRQYGWNDHFKQCFQVFSAKGMLAGRVSFQNQHLYRTYTAQGELQAEVAGRLRFKAASAEELPAVGDWVALRHSDQMDRATIQAVLPRISQVARKTAGSKTEAQIVGANVNTVFLVTSLNQDFNARRIERYLATIREGGAEPVIILSKADLCEDNSFIEAQIKTMREIAKEIAVHAVSAKAEMGIEELNQYRTEGMTIALIGSSGVGKSTLINRLLGFDKQKVKEVREHDDRGQHTTRHRELILLPDGGLVLDTPGMRELQLWDAEAGVQSTFDDIKTLATKCQFNDCKHQSEPNCAVQAAVKNKDLEVDRLENYLKLHAELHQLSQRQEDYARLNEQKKWKKLTVAAEKRAASKRQGTQ